MPDGPKDEGAAGYPNNHKSSWGNNDAYQFFVREEREGGFREEGRRVVG